MAAGPLRELITVQRAGATVDQYRNAQSGDWADVTGMVSIPAQIRPMRGSEFVGGEGIEPRALYEIRIRHTSVLAGIRITDRIIDARDATRTFNIKSPPMDYSERGRWLRFTVEAGGADG